MNAAISIFYEVRDPRDFNARHDLAAMLFIALAATLCGAKSCVDIADFAAANADELAEIIDLRHGPPSHDCFSRLFRLLDPNEVAQAFARFMAVLRESLGLAAPKGVVAVDGKSLRRGYQRGRANMPPLMVSVWDAETRLSLASVPAEGGNEVAATLRALKSVVLKGCVVTADALHCHPRMAAAGDAHVLERGTSAALAARCRLQRGRCAHPQELRPAKSCPPAPYRPRHLARPPRYSLNRTQNEARCLEKAVLLRALCSSAIALPSMRGTRTTASPRRQQQGQRSIGLPQMS